MQEAIKNRASQKGKKESAANEDSQTSDYDDAGLGSEQGASSSESEQADNNPRKAFTDPATLDKVDRLFACGVGQHIDLPQLVVVGDQSSGKSSVLEGLTKLPFPRDSGLCTRFATQITFKRHPTKTTSIYVNPAPNAAPKHQSKLRAWSRPDIVDLKGATFLKIMQEVQDLMGLGSQNESGSSGTFSEDVLRLEISGPDQPHFSIVDVPGIFRKTTEGVTTEEDRLMVLSMVQRYMQNPRSLMLAVIPANQDITTQEILTMAEEVDKPGHRTIGVLTKPDLVDKGAEHNVLELLDGRKHKLHLGWQIVKNLGQADLAGSAVVRDRAEREFFAKQPWDEIKEEQRGVDSLRLRLQDILTMHIRKEFPKVQSEMTQLLTDARRKLKDLGAKRGSIFEQRMYLTDIATNFQRVKSDAMNTRYSSQHFSECPSLRLPTWVRNRNEHFTANMESMGHLFEFDTLAEPKTLGFGAFTFKPLNMLIRDIVKTTAARSIVNPDEAFRVRNPANFLELVDCTIPDDTEVESRAKPEIMEWLDDQHTATKGFEIANVNPALLGTLFREQASKWDALAQGYMSDIIEMVHLFITDLLKHVAPDEHVRSGLTAKLMDPLLEKYQCAFDHVDFLLKVEKETLPMTTNHLFSQMLQELRRQRQEYMDGGNDDDDAISAAPASNMGQNADSTGNKREELTTLHDHLHAYYEVALRRFIDNVQKQAALHYLIVGEESPLELFSASFVNRLTDTELEEIAGEDLQLKRKRASLEKLVADLEAGKNILR